MLIGVIDELIDEREHLQIEMANITADIHKIEQENAKVRVFFD